MFKAKFFKIMLKIKLKTEIKTITLIKNYSYGY